MIDLPKLQLQTRIFNNLFIHILSFYLLKKTTNKIKIGGIIKTHIPTLKYEFSCHLLPYLILENSKNHENEWEFEVGKY